MKKKIKFILMGVISIIVLVIGTFCALYATYAFGLFKDKNYEKSLAALKNQDYATSLRYLAKSLKNHPTRDIGQVLMTILEEVDPITDSVIVLSTGQKKEFDQELKVFEVIQQINQIYDQGKHNMTDWERSYVDFMLVLSNYSTGRYMSAFAICEEMIQRADGKERVRLLEEEALMYLEIGMVDEASQILDQIPPGQGRNDAQIRAWICLLRKDPAGIEQLDLPERDSALSYGHTFVRQIKYHVMIPIIENLKAEGGGTVSGRVKIGKRSGNILVYLIEPDYVWDYDYGNLRYIALTDENGEYQFNNVEPGKYLLGFVYSPVRAWNAKVYSSQEIIEVEYAQITKHEMEIKSVIP